MKDNTSNNQEMPKETLERIKNNFNFMIDDYEDIEEACIQYHTERQRIEAMQPVKSLDECLFEVSKKYFPKNKIQDVLTISIDLYKEAAELYAQSAVAQERAIQDEAYKKGVAVYEKRIEELELLAKSRLKDIQDLEEELNDKSLLLEAAKEQFKKLNPLWVSDREIENIALEKYGDELVIEDAIQAKSEGIWFGVANQMSDAVAFHYWLKNLPHMFGHILTEGVDMYKVKDKWVKVEEAYQLFQQFKQTYKWVK